MWYGYQAPVDDREVALDWGVCQTIEQSRQQYHRWADAMRGRDMRMAILLRNLEDAHAAFQTYCRSVRGV